MAKTKRIPGKLAAAQHARLQRNRRRIAHELPELQARNLTCREASDERTLTGDLRRLIHASPLSLAEIAAKVRIPVLTLDELLTGEPNNAPATRRPPMPKNRQLLTMTCDLAT